MNALQQDSAGNTCHLRFRRLGHESLFSVEGNSALLGRSQDSDLVLEDESVSRRHAVVVREAGGWIIRDMGSRNGVRVNACRVRRTSLQHGDIIDLGAVRLQVEIACGDEESQARVVFQPEEERGRRTGVIDMGELESNLDAASQAEGRESHPPDRQERPFTSEPSSGKSSGVQESSVLLALVHKAAEVLITCESVDEALHQILSLVFQNLPAERGVICLYDETTDTSEPRATRTRSGIAEEPIVISSHIARDVIQRKQSLLVQDTQHDERFGGAESVVELQIHSAMCAPLYHHGRVGGFIYLDQQRDQQSDRQGDFEPFTTSHLHALSTLAVLSGSAVEQCSLRDTVRREREIRARLSRYSSPAVVDQIIQSANSRQPEMVAAEGDVTVLFADLCGFTEMAENLHATQVAQLLNQIFERFTEVVFAHEGTLDKFSGDGMMAFFGAPLPLSDHAERAVKAALELQEELAELNIESLYSQKLSLRIGINSGIVVVGDVGSPQRKDYTVIGDVVNTASRLESFVAEPGQTVVGQNTYELVRERFRMEALEPAQLKGKSRLVQPYRVLGRLASRPPSRVHESTRTGEPA